MIFFLIVYILSKNILPHYKNINKIFLILQSIRDKYACIREMTETLNVDSKYESCLHVINQREKILAEIADENKNIDLLHSRNQQIWETDPSVIQLRNEIQLLISASLALDNIIQEKMNQKMEDIKSEITSLGQNSKVALSYARHVT